MKRKLILLMVMGVIISLIATIGLSSCRQAVEEVVEEVEEAVEEVEEAVEEAVEEIEEEPAEEELDLVFGNLPTALSDEWNGYSVENFLFAADIKGVEVQVIDAGWDGAKQLNDLEDLIA